jgi:hypothetical protein
VVLCAILASACSSSPASTNDLGAVDLAGDASVGDLASGDARGAGDGGADGGGLCAGTSLAGTCVESFFAGVIGCFQPSGACVTQSTSSMTSTCWANGARLVQTGAMGMGWSYESGATTCFYGSWSYTAGTQQEYTFALPTAPGNQLLVYNRATGVTTCLDGSHVTLPPDFGGCDAIRALVDLMPSGCTPGTC